MAHGCHGSIVAEFLPATRPGDISLPSSQRRRNRRLWDLVEIGLNSFCRFRYGSHGEEARHAA